MRMGWGGLNHRTKEDDDMRIGRNLLALVGLAALAVGISLTVVPAASATEWKAIALNERGDWYKVGSDNNGDPFYDEQSARDFAANLCENEWARTCYLIKSVPYSWTLSAIMCDGTPSAGGSKYGSNGADRQAINNAGGCNHWYNITYQ